MTTSRTQEDAHIDKYIRLTVIVRSVSPESMAREFSSFFRLLPTLLPSLHGIVIAFHRCYGRCDRCHPPRQPRAFSHQHIYNRLGGIKFLTNAFLSVRALRRAGCTLPVEIWCVRGILASKEADFTMIMNTALPNQMRPSVQEFSSYQHHAHDLDRSTQKTNPCKRPPNSGTMGSWRSAQK